MKKLASGLLFMVLLPVSSFAAVKATDAFPDYSKWSLREKPFLMSSSNREEEFASMPYLSNVLLNLGKEKWYTENVSDPKVQPRAAFVAEVFGKLVLRAVGTAGPERTQLLVNGKWVDVTWGTWRVKLVDVNAWLKDGKMKGVVLSALGTDGVTEVKTTVVP